MSSNDNKQEKTSSSTQLTAQPSDKCKTSKFNLSLSQFDYTLRANQLRNNEDSDYTIYSSTSTPNSLELDHTDFDDKQYETQIFEEKVPENSDDIAPVQSLEL